ncbi:hypothetical protein [Millisia brevis]|uniref:hypothetical protein n=1 Tax=Millisia brevis TaxID=264148 RepID=UPI000830D9C9|nr:hypothetical protein [Millisia brevis]
MNVAARLGAFAVAAVLVFGAAFGIAAAVVPDGFADRWQPAGGTHDVGTHTGTDGADSHDGGHGDAGTGDGR